MKKEMTEAKKPNPVRPGRAILKTFGILLAAGVALDFIADKALTKIIEKHVDKKEEKEVNKENEQ